MHWNDPRLAFDDIKEPLVIQAQIIDQIWKPDIYFPNEKYAEFHDVTVPNRQMMITPEGNCTYSIR